MKGAFKNVAVEGALNPTPATLNPQPYSLQAKSNRRERRLEKHRRGRRPKLTLILNPTVYTAKT